MKINENLITRIKDYQRLILEHESIPRLQEREILMSVDLKPIKVISGFRRSGKSYLLRSIIQNLVATKIFDIDNVLYLNFEDYKLTEFNNVEKLDELHQTFMKIVAKEGHKILAFDEIHLVKDWDRFIRTIYEFNKNDQIFITGSNSEMLSSELGSNLAGRFIEFNIQPFSFAEFLSYHDYDIDYSSEHFFIGNQDLEKFFYQYLEYGGLSEAYDTESKQLRSTYVSGIISKVILDDVIERFAIRNIVAIEKILQYLLTNVGHVISYTKLTRYLNQTGIKIQDETVIEYISHLQKTFALYEVSKFDWSTKKIFQGSKKFYAIDTALINLYQSLSQNFSMLIENIVFLKLRTQAKNIYYANDGERELDFITETLDGQLVKYQVTQRLNKDNMSRELGSFVKSDKYLGKYPNIILVLDGQDEEINYQGSIIQQKSLIKWLVSPIESKF